MNVKTRVGTSLLIAGLAAALAVQPAQAAVGAWQATFLPMPAGHENDKGRLTATNGQGEYTGSFQFPDRSEIISWRLGQPVLRGAPAGYDWTHVQDENSAGTVLLDASGAGDEAVFILDAAGFHRLPTPAGYKYVHAVAINDRGDVVGQLLGDATDKGATVLWPAISTGQGPIVIPSSGPGEIPADLDDDGSILLNADSGAFLWKNGATRPLAAPAGHGAPYASSIKNGVVVGDATSGTTGQAFRWTTPLSPEPLPGGAFAFWLNSSGLIAGGAEIPGSIRVKPSTWDGTKPAGELPAPAGYKNFTATAVGEDGTLPGIASNGPLDEGGAPVVWRR